MMRLRAGAPQAAVTLGFGVLLLSTACNDQSPSPAPTTQPPENTSPAKVEVEVARRQPLARRIPIVGTLHAAEEAVISTKSAGVLRQTFVDVGSKVAPGDPLTQVDRDDYEMTVMQSEALLAESLARLGVDSVPTQAIDLGRVSTVRRAAASLENARFTFDRLKSLKDAVSAQELNDAMAQVRVAEADHRLSLDEAAALAASARGRHAALKQARQRLDETLTRTPPIPTTLGQRGAAEWVVAERLVTEGQFLNAAEQTYRLIINNPLKLRARVPEHYASEVRIGQSAILESAGGRTPAEGTITRISPVVDPASRTFEIEALIENDSEGLMSGSFAKGVILVDDQTATVSIPEDAIYQNAGATQIFVVQDGRARRRNIQTGRKVSGRVAVVSGLAEGEQVIARTMPSLTDGAAVQAQ